MSFRLFARAPLTTIEPRVAGRREPRRLDRAFAAQVRAGQRSVGSVGPVALEQRLRRPLEDHVAAVLAGAGPEIDDVVGGADRLLVVLDDDDGVAEIAQPRQRREQRAVVALVQADRRLVEHVEHAGQVRADLRRQADALPFAARQRRGAAAEREVADADVVEEAQAIADLAQDAAGDQVLAVGQFERVEHLAPPRRSAGSTYSVIVRPLTRTARLCGFRRSPLTRRARPQRAVRLEALPDRPRCLFVAPAQIRNQALEAGAERIVSSPFFFLPALDRRVLGASVPACAP